MKKTALLLTLALIAAPAHAQVAGDKLFFGKDKGQQVLSDQDIQNRQTQEQLKNLQTVADELKKTNELLTKQNQLLQQQVDNEQKRIVALLKGFDTIMQKYSTAGGKPAAPRSR